MTFRQFSFYWSNVLNTNSVPTEQISFSSIQLPFQIESAWYVQDSDGVCGDLGSDRPWDWKWRTGIPTRTLKSSVPYSNRWPVKQSLRASNQWQLWHSSRNRRRCMTLLFIQLPIAACLLWFQSLALNFVASSSRRRPSPASSTRSRHFWSGS